MRKLSIRFQHSATGGKGALSLKLDAPQWFPARAKNHAPRQKRRWFLFSQGGLPPFQPGDPSATASLCGNEERRFLELSPGPFCLWRLLSCPGNKRTGLSYQLIGR